MKELRTLDRPFILLYVDDIERATAFYRDVLGLPLTYAAPDWVQFGGDGALVVLSLRTHAHKESASTASSAHLAFQVQDLEAEISHLRSRGVAFELLPSNAGSGKHVTFGDPEGNKIDLWEVGRLSGAAVTPETLVNNIIAKHPETMEVFENHGIRICGGCLVLLNSPVYETAEYSGLDSGESSALLGELNKKLKELQESPVGESH